MLIKICGLKYRENILAIGQLCPDFIGFIFYPKSKRYLAEAPELDTLPESIQKVGVFVNPTFETVRRKIAEFSLDYVQLHGKETPEFCKELKQENIRIIKAFSVASAADLAAIRDYEENCTYALLDTRTSDYGGSGKCFDWTILEHYTAKLDFLLSGGLGLHNIEEALQLRHPRLIGFDLNSRLEEKPGLKSIEQTSIIIQKINHYERNTPK